MTRLPNSDIEEYFASLSTDEREIVAALRKVLRSALPETEETVAWGALSYHRPWLGGRIRGAVCQIVVKRGQIRLDFIHGACLPDPHRLLIGNRKAKRFVPIISGDMAKLPAIVQLVRAAAEYDPTQETT